MSFAAKANPCIRGRVLDEDGRFHRTRETGEMVDILRVHMRRVSVAVFRFHRQIDCLIDVVYSYNGKNRHHKLVLYEGVFEIRFANDTTHVLAYVYADFCKQDFRVSAYAITANRLFDDTRLGVLNVHKHDVRKLCRLLRVDFVRTVFEHCGDKLVRNVTEYEYFLFRDTRQVIIERATVDDVLAGFLNVRRVVYDDGRVTCACADCFLTAGKNAS